MGVTPTTVSQAPTTSGDLANAVISGQFTVAGAPAFSGVFVARGPFNVVFGGTGGPNGNWNGSIQLERSFDGGTTWFICGIGGSGQQAIWNTNNQDVSIIVSEPEQGVAYRLHNTSMVSGTVSYRISTTGSAARSESVPSV